VIKSKNPKGATYNPAPPPAGWTKNKVTLKCGMCGRTFTKDAKCRSYNCPRCRPKYGRIMRDCFGALNSIANSINRLKLLYHPYLVDEDGNRVVKTSLQGKRIFGNAKPATVISG